MKNSILGIVGILFISLFFLVSCTKENQNQLSPEKYENKIRSGDYLQDAGIYVTAGTTMFCDCGLAYRCGPCPAICIRSGTRPKFAEKFSLDLLEFDEGAFRIKDIGIDFVIVEFLTDNLVYNGKTYLEEDFSLGDDVSNAYGFQNITFKEGVYYVDFNEYEYGMAKIDVILN